MDQEACSAQIVNEVFGKDFYFFTNAKKIHDVLMFVGFATFVFAREFDDGHLVGVVQLNSREQQKEMRKQYPEWNFVFPYFPISMFLEVIKINHRENQVVQVGQLNMRGRMKETDFFLSLETRTVWVFGLHKPTQTSVDHIIQFFDTLLNVRTCKCVVLRKSCTRIVQGVVEFYNPVAYNDLIQLERMVWRRPTRYTLAVVTKSSNILFQITSECRLVS